MIAQILNRDFLLNQLDEIKAQLGADIATGREGGSAPGTEELRPEDYREALAALHSAQSRETVQSSGQESFPPQPSGRRGPAPAPLDDFSFFSRDPIVSNLQSALEQYLESRSSETQLTDDPRTPVPGRRGVFEEVAVTNRSLPGVNVSRSSTGRRVFDKFSISDIGWVSSALASGIRLFRGKHNFNTNPPEPLQVGDRARIVVVGDWGTGIPRAQNVAAQMRKEIESAPAENRDVHVVHLGDVYYSGWGYEYNKRFLPFWPVKTEEAGKITSWSLNGNHDMYSGGHAYYNTLLADPRFEKQNQCSYFSFYNKNWRILGLDTSWDDNALKDPQSDWVRSMVDSDERKLMLFSHHQLFSAYESAGTAIADKLQYALDKYRVRAWYWGHEHRCMLFDPYGKVGFARCVGHGGVPVYMPHKLDDPYVAPGIYEYRDMIVKGLEKWAKFGFAVLDFEDSYIHARYVDENGFQHREENFE